MTISNDIAFELKRIRQLHGWSQEDFARELGVSFATVNRWENGKTKPSRLAQDRIKQIAKKTHNERIKGILSLLEKKRIAGRGNVYVKKTSFKDISKAPIHPTAR